MFSKIDRYYVRQVLPYYAGSVGLFVMLFVLGQLRLIIETVAVSSLSFWLVLKLLILSVPFNLFVSMPVGLTLANALTFGYMSVHSEIMAMRSFGISVDIFLKIVILIAFATVLLNIANEEFLFPYTQKLYKTELYRNAVQTIESVIIEKKITQFQNYQIFVDNIVYKGDQKTYQNVVIIRDSEGGRDSIYAKSGYIDKSFKKDDLLVMHLMSGTYLSYYNDSKYLKATFDTMDLYFALPTSNSIGTDLLEVPLYKMLAAMKVTKKGDNAAFRSYENIFHFKLGIILSGFLFAFSGFALVKGFRNLNIGAAITSAIIIIMTFYGIFMFASKMIITRLAIPAALVYYSLLGVLFLIGLSIYLAGFRNR